MTRLGTAVALAYGLAAIVVFLSVMAIWPTSSVPSPSLSVIRTPRSSDSSTPSLRTSAEPSPSNGTTAKPARPSPRPTTRPPQPTKAPTAPPTPTKAPTEPPILAIRGEATFYCLPPLSPCTVGFPAVGLYAAAGAELRAALGDWRGRKVTVWYGSSHVTVTLIDTCSCDVDLYAAAFVLLAPLELGVLDVEIRW